MSGVTLEQRERIESMGAVLEAVESYVATKQRHQDLRVRDLEAQLERARAALDVERKARWAVQAQLETAPGLPE